MKMAEYTYSRNRFWKNCIQIARAQPNLCAEEVERRAVLLELGLYPKMA